MTKKIFHSILLVAGTVLLASLLVIMGCLYEYFGSVEKKQLRDELELAAVAVKENGAEYLSQLSSERYRLTWIENDGTVLYDTVTDAESLENHADRVEVKQALEYGEGESTRYSSTLLQKTMYCAERLADGSVLRISMSRATAGVLLVGMGQPILVVLIVALILSSVLAKSLSHRIVQPLNKLDLEHPLENDAHFLFSRRRIVPNLLRNGIHGLGAEAGARRGSLYTRRNQSSGAKQRCSRRFDHFCCHLNLLNLF